jgi:Ca2+-binding RTX toxin-like protein/predicted extracellular nuclease
MTIKPHVVRNGARNWQQEAETLRGDDTILSGHREIFTKEAGTAGPQTAASPDTGPQHAPPTAGTIAFTGFNADDPDSFAFVALDDIAAGTVITFDDNEWSGTAFNTGEGTITLTLTSMVSAGTIVRIDGSNTATPTTSHGTLARAGTFDLSGTTESLYAYTGTTAAPNFLTAIGISGFTGATTTGLLTNTGLTLGTNAIDLGVIDAGADIGAYNGARSGQASFGAYAAIINDTANWITQDASGSQAADGTPPDVPFSSVAFTTGAVSETQTIVFNPTSVTQAEGDSGFTTYSFTVTRTGGTTGQLDFSGVIALGAGVDGADFLGNVAPTAFAGSILAGQTSATVTVSVQGDNTIEGDESFTLNIEAASNASAGVTTVIGTNDVATGNITNDDVVGTLAINDVSMNEGDSGTTAFTFTVTRSGGNDGAISADWTLNLPGGGGNADSADVDAGQALTGTVSFAQGETSQTITILVSGDTVFEQSESFSVTLSNPQGGTSITDAVGAGTIQNDDPAPAGTLSINDVSLSEGDSGPTTFTFTVSRTGGTTGSVTADYVISAPGGGGNADSADFVPTAVFTGQVSFADGENSQTITIDVQGDTDFEANENFTVTLSNATGGAAIGDGTGLGTIQNDDAAPVTGSVSVSDVSILEGNAGTSLLTFTLTRTGGTGAFDVNYATSNGGAANHASATAGSDYLTATGTASFAIGQMTQTVTVTINGDVTPELSEEFTLTLSSPTNGATIGSGTAIGTIITDDAAPASTLIFSENFTGFTAGGFAPNPTAGQIDSDIWRVVGLSDIANPAYGFTGAAGTDFGRGTITTNDPTQAGVYSVSTNAALVVQPTGAEMDSGGFIEARILNTSGSTATGFDVVFDWVYRNSGDRASALQFSYSTDGTNFVTVPLANFTTSGTLDSGATFTTEHKVLTLSGLSVANGDAIFLRWTHVSSTGSNSRDEVGIDNLTVSTTGGAGGPLVSVTDVSVNEAAGTMTFTVTRSNVAAGAFTVDYQTANGTAFAGSDYTATSGTLSFSDNQVSATVTVLITDEGIPELNETLFLNLLNPVGATIADAQGVGTIQNDDGTPIQISINDVSIVEGQAGTSTLTFTVTRSGGTGAFDVSYTTADDSATQPSDYLTSSGTLNFGAGVNTQTVSVTINGDLTQEQTERFFVNLFNPTNNAIIIDAQGIGTITNDEPTYIHDIQGTAYYSPILAGDGISTFNTASTTAVTVRAIVTAVDNVGNRQGYYLSEELVDWDGNAYTSEGIFVMTRNDSGVGNVVSGVSVGDLVQLSANVMEYQHLSNMPRTVLVNPTGLSIVSTGNALPILTLTGMPNTVMTPVSPDYTDSSDGVGDTFDASVYALSYYETVEGMLVTIPNMVVADGFVGTSGGDPFFQAYSLDSANVEQINSRGGYTIGGDPALAPPDTANPNDTTVNGGQILHDGDINPDIIELDFTDFAISAPAGLSTSASMGDFLGSVTGIIDFDFTDRKLFVTDIDAGAFVNTNPTIETTAFGSDSRSLTVATFNVENLDPGDGAARFTAIANAIASNLKSPDIICIEEMQDNNGATDNGVTDASTTWGMLVAALNAATGKVYQWVDEAPTNDSEGGEPGGNIRVGFLYDTGRVQLGNLDANASLADRRKYTDRIGDGVRDTDDLIAFSDNMLGGEINTTDWAGTRRSLLGEFHFNGNTVYLTANHWPAKGGSGNFWQFDQSGGDPANSDWAQRNAVGQDVYSMLNLIEQGSGGAGIVSGGDYNDFYFYRPLTTMTGYTMADGTARVGGTRLENLTLTLPEAERYTYTFDGRAQAIDHIIVNGLLGGVASYDVVHLNTGFNPSNNPQLSDHEPAIASFDYRNFSELLNGTVNADTILGFGGDDTINGGEGDDLLIGGLGTDTLNGNGGNDVIYGEAGIDTARGGTGNDTYIVDTSTDIVLEAIGEGNDQVLTQVSYLLTSGADVEVLSTTVHSGTAAIELTGNYGNQVIYGNFGNNVITGGVGADILVGFAGNDTFIVHDAQAQINEGVGDGTDVVFSSVSYTLTAGAEVEVLSTTFHGGTGAINLTGNEFANVIYGNFGSNTLQGGGGADTLNGFQGSDTLTGGSGADSFQFTTSVGPGNVAALTDFVSGTDRIVLEDAVFLGASNGNLASVFVQGTQAGDANDRLIYNFTTGQLFYDADGNGAGAAVLFAQLNPGTALTASDFLMI